MLQKMSLTPKNGRINVVIWNDSTMGRKRENVYYILPNIKLSTAKFDQICNRKLCTKELTELLPIRLSPIHEENHKQLYEFWTLVPSICTKKYIVSLLIPCLSILFTIDSIEFRTLVPAICITAWETSHRFWIPRLKLANEDAAGRDSIAHSIPSP